MRLLIDYTGLAQHLHISAPECFELLLSEKELSKQRRSNPEYFVEQSDRFETFFYQWRDEQEQAQLRLERRLLDWDCEFSKLRQHNEDTNAILRQLLPLLTSFISKIETMSDQVTQLTAAVTESKQLTATLITTVNTKLDANTQALKDLQAKLDTAGQPDPEIAQDISDIIADNEQTKAEIAALAPPLADPGTTQPL